MIRTFIGIKLNASDALSDCCKDIQRGLKGEGINWVKPDNFHLTLKFLGKTSEAQILQVIESLREVTARLFSFSFQLKGIGYFGRKKEPRVLWIGVEEGGNLKYLQKLIDQSMVDFGFEAEKMDYKPHLTLARIKKLSDCNKFHRTILPFQNIHFQEELVQGITFFESRLTQEGAIYLPIAEHKFNFH
ncbi:MAG: RNA 2',3'-cyclic phosphodiesterase [Bacteroidales bacterium]|nr:RNA 2',3'-cyclic phosphodiesterase [Bacteroidales bacterium]MCF8454491.1 RNA 2',3'-cyclic phosphodiesterase [Bacteroidales bacterium]